MERTGHRNVKSLHKYQRVGSKEREVVSDVLQLPRKSCLEKNTRESPRKKIVLDRSSVDTSCIVPRLHLLTAKLYLT